MAAMHLLSTQTYELIGNSNDYQQLATTIRDQRW